jgi:hypothetical protein
MTPGDIDHKVVAQRALWVHEMIAAKSLLKNFMRSVFIT